MERLEDNILSFVVEKDCIMMFLITLERKFCFFRGAVKVLHSERLFRKKMTFLFESLRVRAF